MSDPNVIIEHEDGRRYSTTVDGFHELYEPQGFEIVGEESPASFELVGVPQPKAPRRKPRAKVAAPLEETPEPEAEPESASEADAEPA